MWTPTHTQQGAHLSPAVVEAVVQGLEPGGETDPAEPVVWVHVRLTADATESAVDPTPDPTLEPRRMRARRALPLPIELEPGDAVLVAHEGDAAFVIGVLTLRRGRPLNIRFAGDATLQAAGTLRLEGQQAEMEGDRVALRAGRLELFATSLWSRVKDAFQTIEGLLQRRVGRVRTVVDGSKVERVERYHLQAERDVTVDGEQIHLG